jgi:hypothetical protein
MHSWLIFFVCVLTWTEVFTFSDTEKAFRNDLVLRRDQNSLFPLLHGRLKKLCDTFFEDL